MPCDLKDTELQYVVLFQSNSCLYLSILNYLIYLGLSDGGWSIMYVGFSNSPGFWILAARFCRLMFNFKFKTYISRLPFVFLCLLKDIITQI